MQIFGIVGGSGSGKTHLLTALLPELVGRGVRVSTIKHTHHDIEIDQPGKDSYRHRQSGATEVLVTSPKRWALMHELRDTHEPDLEELIRHMTPVDVLLVEGFRGKAHKKLEVHRPTVGKPLLAQDDVNIVAVASDVALADVTVPVLDLADVGAIADFIVTYLKLDDGAVHGG